MNRSPDLVYQFKIQLRGVRPDGTSDLQAEYEGYDPEVFDPRRLVFDDPAERLIQMLDLM